MGTWIIKVFDKQGNLQEILETLKMTSKRTLR